MFILDRSKQAHGRFLRKAKNAMKKHIKRRTSEFASVSIITYGARSKNAPPQTIINKDTGKTLLLKRIRHMQQDEQGVTDAEDLDEALEMAHNVLAHQLIERETQTLTPLHEIVVLGKSGVGQYNSSLCMVGHQKVSYLFVGSCPRPPTNHTDSENGCYKSDMCSKHTHSPKKALQHFFSGKKRSVFEKSPKQVRGGSNQSLMGFVNISSVVDTTRTQHNTTIYCLQFNVDTNSDHGEDVYVRCENYACNLTLHVEDAGPCSQSQILSRQLQAFFQVRRLDKKVRLDVQTIIDSLCM